MRLRNPCRSRVVLLAAGLLILVAGCSSMPDSRPARLAENYYLTPDQQRLPYRLWLPPGPPKAVLVALHGFNDYSNFFAGSGRYLAGQGVASYAYDQRGFGGSGRRGHWAGSAVYQRDLRHFISLVRKQHPGVPVYVLGESMGGAVAMVTLAAGPVPEGVAGLILAAPAVWGRDSMPWYQNSLLWVSATMVPWLTVSGGGLDITPSDNTRMLMDLGWDPLVIKQTRMDAIEGLVDLMDQAQASAKKLRLPLMVLYGDRDEIIPKEPTYRMLRQQLERKTSLTVAFYRDGYHMLLRDLQASVVLDDIAVWVESPGGAPLPSAADRHARETLAGLGRVQYPAR